MDQQTIGPENIFDKIRYLVLSTYTPALTLKESNLQMTTEQIYLQLQTMFPSQGYGPDQVAFWLEDWGFKLANTGPMRFEWMLKKVR